MTAKQGLFDKAAETALRLPTPRIVGWMLGAASLFFCLSIPRPVVDRMMATAGLPGGFVGHGLLTAVFTALVAGCGWRVLAFMVDRDHDLAAAKVRARPAAPRRRPVGAVGATAPDAPMTLRRGDAHPDAPPRRPIFAAHDLGASFDDLGKAPAAPVPPAAAPEASHDAEAFESDIAAEAEPFELNVAAADDARAPAAEETAMEFVDEDFFIVADEAVVADEPTVPPAETAADETGAADEFADGTFLIDEPAAVAELVEAHEPAAAADDVADDGPVDDEASLEDETVGGADPEAEAEPVVAEETLVADEPVDEPAEDEPPATDEHVAEDESAPAEAPRDAEEPASLSALMARFEGGLDRLDGDLPPPPSSDAVAPRAAPVSAPGRDTEEALRDALAALQRMAARQR